MVNDFRYALRQLIRAPSFTIVAILTLALGIGACTAIFSVVNVVLLRPLDYPEPDRIVTIRETQLPKFPEFSVSPPNYLDWEKQTKSYEYLAAYTGARVNLTGDGEPQQLIGVKATGAQQGDVLRLVLTQGGKLIGLGLAIGLIATLAASRAIGSMLFNTSAYDPLTLSSITLLLGAVALIACFFPANRATNVNPIEALRTE